MNIKRGLFRIWVLFAAIFSVSSLCVLTPNVESEFHIVTDPVLLAVLKASGQKKVTLDVFTADAEKDPKPAPPWEKETPPLTKMSGEPPAAPKAPEPGKDAKPWEKYKAPSAPPAAPAAPKAPAKEITDPTLLAEFYDAAGQQTSGMIVEAPDGKVLEFPTSMNDDQILATMRKIYLPAKYPPAPHWEAWWALLRMIAFSFGMPLLILLFERAIMWVIAGFVSVPKVAK